MIDNQLLESDSSTHSSAGCHDDSDSCGDTKDFNHQDLEVISQESCSNADEEFVKPEANCTTPYDLEREVDCNCVSNIDSIPTDKQ